MQVLVLLRNKTVLKECQGKATIRLVQKLFVIILSNRELRFLTLTHYLAHEATERFLFYWSFAPSLYLNHFNEQNCYLWIIL